MSKPTTAALEIVLAMRARDDCPHHESAYNYECAKCVALAIDEHTADAQIRAAARWRQACVERDNELIELRAEVERLRPDAERMAWLCEKEIDDEIDFRDAIDAARREGED